VLIRSALAVLTPSILVIAIAGCGGGAPPPPEAAPPPAAKSPAVTRADELIADMKRREAAQQQSATPAKPVDITSSNYTVAERGKASWRLTWRMSVRNYLQTPIRVRAEMDFKDIKGVLIATGEQTLTIAGGAAAEASGAVSVKPADGPRVVSATPRFAILKSS
jgi:hypothetical protein